MEEEIKPSEVPKTKETKDKKTLKTLVYILIVLVLIGLAAGAAYWWRDKTANDSADKNASEISVLEKDKANLIKQLATLKPADTSITPGQTECTSKSPTTTVIGNIEASITSGNTAALEGYMADSVNVILAASEGIGPSTPTAAVSSITNFITSDITAWDYNFSLPASVLSSYSNGSYSQYFPNNAVVGKATNGKVISLSFDCNAKISTVFMAASEGLLQ